MPKGIMDCSSLTAFSGQPPAPVRPLERSMDNGTKAAVAVVGAAAVGGGIFAIYKAAGRRQAR